MPNLEFRLVNLIQVLDNRLAYAQPLTLTSLSTLLDDPARAVQALNQMAREEFQNAPAQTLYQFALAENPKGGTFKITLGAPPNGTWDAPLTLEFHYVKWTHAEQGLFAFIPALDVLAAIPSAQRLEEVLVDEATFALGRLKALNALDRLVALQRVQELEIRAETVTAHLPSLKHSLQQAQKPEPEGQVISEVGEDLTRTALVETYERDALVAILAEALTADPPRSVLLVGKSGVGKTAVVRELVRQRARNQLAHTPFWATSGSRLVAGMAGFGMWQERCQKLCRQAAHARAVVYTGNLMELLSVGKAEGIEQGVGGFLRPYIGRGELQIVVECTPEQIPLIEREEPHLLALLQRIDVPEPDAAEGQRILRRYAEALGPGYDVLLSDEAFDKLDRLHRRYTTYSAYPGRPLRFLDSLLFEAPRGTLLDACTVAAAFSRETGLPAFLLDPSIGIDLDGTRRWLEGRVLGQPAAIETVLDVLVAVKAGLARPRRPLASLLFIGPTGVGKTEMAKAIAELFFSDRARLSRFDMSEYSEGDALSRLVGSALRGEGALTARVREQPFSVILLDEVEKAHPACFDLLLQVLGDARLTDASGRVADFSNAIVIMTSNLGAESYQLGRSGFAAAGRNRVPAQAHFTQEVQRFFRPEFVNRMDHIIPFLPLDAATLRNIATREIGLVSARDGLLLRHAELRADPGVLDHLTEKSCNTGYGARPLKREIERTLLAPLAEKLNSYSAEAQITADVRLNGEELKIDASARPDEDSRASASLAALGLACATMRRRVDRLQTSSAVSELRGNIWRLERLLTRAQKGARPPRGTERLPHLQRTQADLESTHAAVHRTEEEVLLRIYGQSQDSLDAIASQLEQLKQDIDALLLQLYAHSFEASDYVLLALYSEDRDCLFELLSAYLHIARQRQYSPVLQVVHLCHRHCPCSAPLNCAPEESALNRHDVQHPQRFANDPGPWREKSLGYVLAVRGALAAPLLLAEGGGHTFKADRNTSTCIVDTRTIPLQAFQLPAGLERRGKLPQQPQRREYNMESRTMDDTLLARKFGFQGTHFAPAMDEAITATLKRFAEAFAE